MIVVCFSLLSYFDIGIEAKGLWIGFDTFEAQLSLAKSPEFATWAALATGGNTTPVAGVPAVSTAPVTTMLVSVVSPAASAKTSSAKKGEATKKGKDDDEEDDD